MRKLILHLVVLLCIAVHSKAQSSWLNPLPQAHQLSSIQFLDANVGLAVGNFGTILKTTDGGTNWTIKTCNQSNDLRSICLVNSTTAYVCGAGGTLLKSTDAGESWTALNSGTINLLTCVYFLDLNTGFTVGQSGKILKTIDAGITWTAIPSGVTVVLQGIAFTSPLDGYIVGTSGRVLKTIDGGDTWSSQNISGINFQSVYFPSANTGYACGLQGRIFKTIDAGISWQSLTTGSPDALYSIKFVNDNLGYACGAVAKVLKTTDGGSTWTDVFNVGGIMDSFYFQPLTLFSSISLIDAVSMVTVGTNGQIVKSTDEGATWNRLESGAITNINGLKFFDANNGYAVGGRKLFSKTTDGGTTWNFSNLNGIPSSIGDLYCLYFFDQNNGFVGGYNASGAIYKTSDGGNNWVEIPVGSAAGSVKAFHFVTPNIGYAVGSLDLSTVYKTIDGGNSWSFVSGTANAATSVFFLDMNTGFVTDDGGGLYKYDTIYDQFLNILQLEYALKQITFINDTIGFIIGGNGTIMKTTDRGVTWITKPSGTTQTLLSISFLDQFNGVATGTMGTLISTTDGGETWSTFSSGTNLSLNAGCLTAPDKIIYTGHSGSILKYDLVPATKTLTLTSIFPEGLYAGLGTLNQANDELGAHWPAGVADHITVELHDAANYATIAYSAADVPLSTSGAATVSIPSTYNGSYYITIRHRNSLQTVSATAQSFAGGTISQSFGSTADVFGGNLVQMTDLGYAIYSGDVNQDDIIDLGDSAPVDNQAAMAGSGYMPEDVNGDGLVDLSDAAIIDNNAAQAVGAVTP